MSKKVIVKDSTVPNIGKGLFAKINIAKDSVIAEFKGKLRKPKEKLTSGRSNIYFSDEYILECGTNDQASFANDAINFTKTPRKLMKSLESSMPFYTKYDNAIINASIKLNNNLHRAFLMASDDIKAGEEIFCHYGFPYWFVQEITTVGFLQENEIDKNGFPNNIFEYPAFESYLKNFYPKYTHFEVNPFRDGHDVILHFNDGYKNLITMNNYSNKISKVSVDTLIQQKMNLNL